jgi:hypothetical protein
MSITLILLNVTMVIFALGAVAAGLAIAFRLQPRASPGEPRGGATVLASTRDCYRVAASYLTAASIATATNSSAR